MANTEFYYQNEVFDAMLFVFDANGKMSKYLLENRTTITIQKQLECLRLRGTKPREILSAVNLL